MLILSQGSSWTKLKYICYGFITVELKKYQFTVLIATVIEETKYSARPQHNFFIFGNFNFTSNIFAFSTHIWCYTT
jgi:hypothetical protein